LQIVWNCCSVLRHCTFFIRECLNVKRLLDFSLHNMICILWHVRLINLYLYFAICLISRHVRESTSQWDTSSAIISLIRHSYYIIVGIEITMSLILLGAKVYKYRFFLKLILKIDNYRIIIETSQCSVIEI